MNLVRFIKLKTIYDNLEIDNHHDKLLFDLFLKLKCNNDYYKYIGDNLTVYNNSILYFNGFTLVYSVSSILDICKDIKYDELYSLILNFFKKYFNLVEISIIETTSRDIRIIDNIIY